MVDLLTLLKLDLGISHTHRDEYFVTLLNSSKKEIERKGITLSTDDVEDQVLIADYAAWSYRKRQEDVPLANNIHSRIRNRIVRERIKRNGVS